MMQQKFMYQEGNLIDHSVYNIFLLVTTTVRRNIINVFGCLACIQTSPLRQEKSGEETSVNRHR